MYQSPMGKVKDVEVVKLLLQDKKYQSPMGKVKTKAMTFYQ